MPNAELLTPGDRFIGLFVGPTGSGKKVAACSFPHPIKYYDFDGRIRGILGADWIEKKGISYEYYPPRLQAGVSNFQKLNDEFAGLLTSTQVGQCPYKTLVIGSLTGMTFCLLSDAIPLTHAMKSRDGKNVETGKRIGVMNMPGPEDYGFEANGTYQIMAFLRSIPIPNIIVTAHVIDRYGRSDPNDPFSERIIIGEKISLRDKIAANVPSYFDHIFQFEKRMQGLDEHFFCQFRGDLPRTTYRDLPSGSVDITKKDFYKHLMERVIKAPTPLASAELASAELAKP